MGYNDEDHPFDYFDEYPQDDPFNLASDVCIVCGVFWGEITYDGRLYCGDCYQLEVNTMIEKSKNG